MTMPPTPPTGPQFQTGTFQFNRPTIISLLYLASCLVGFTAIVGVVLAYVWRNEPQGFTAESWEASHYTYLIRTFWLGLIGGLLSAVLMLVLIGFVLAAVVIVLVVVRCVLSLVNAQKQQPMPNPLTWWV